jgi:hypothetical protein
VGPRAISDRPASISEQSGRRHRLAGTHLRPTHQGPGHGQVTSTVIGPRSLSENDATCT